MDNRKHSLLTMRIIRLLNCTKEVCDYDWSDAPDEVIRIILPLNKALCELVRELQDAASTRH